MTVEITLNGVDYEVPSSAADTNWAAIQVLFEQALALAVSTNTTDIAEITAAIAQQAYTAITPLNSWANVGGGAFNLSSAKASNGLVNVRGRIEGGVEGSVCGNLPSGRRPVAPAPAIAQLTNGDYLCRLTVQTNGDITVGAQFNPGGGDVGDGIAFDFTFSTSANTA